MVRAGNLTRLGALISALVLAAIPASAEPPRPAGFGVSAGDFEGRFNREAGQRGGGALTKTKCAGETCTFLYRSVAVNVSTVQGAGDRLDGLMWICGKGCQAAELAIGISLSLRILAPGLPDQRYGSWLGEAAEALQNKRKMQVTVGSAKLSLGSYGDLGLLAFITSGD